MACCDPVTPPNECTNKPCDQLYSACCVIQETNLPCLFPPVYANLVSGGAAYTYTLVVSVLNGTIEEGMSIILGTGTGEGAVVTSVAPAGGGNFNVTLSVANTAAVSGPLGFAFTNIKQCDVNEALQSQVCTPDLPCIGTDAGLSIPNVLLAIDNKFCQLTPPGSCGSWTTLDVDPSVAEASSLSFPFSPSTITYTSPVQLPQYKIDQCNFIHLRGIVKQTITTQAMGGVCTIYTSGNSLFGGPGIDPNLTSGYGFFGALPAGTYPDLYSTPIYGQILDAGGNTVDVCGVSFTLFVLQGGQMFVSVTSTIGGFGGGSDYTLVFSLDNVAIPFAGLS